MADIVLGAGTSHSPMLALTAEQWVRYSTGDLAHPELVFPPHGHAMSYEKGLGSRVAVADEELTAEYFEAQSEACQRGIAELAKTFSEVNPDVTVIISDDQDEWFFEDMMPTFAVYWGETAPIFQLERPSVNRDPDISAAIDKGYWSADLDVPVAADLGRHVIDHMISHDFDIAHFNYLKPKSGGRVARRYPTATGELDSARETEPRAMPLPHGFSFVVNRIFGNEPRRILPLFQNTCYPPNQPTAKRSYQFGTAIADAIRSWDSNARVAVVGSGGLSHFVVDEELDRAALKGLQDKDPEILKTLPRHRLYSAASETQNWVALGGAMQETSLTMELIEYVPVYRTPAGTGGGWAFARWL